MGKNRGKTRDNKRKRENRLKKLRVQRMSGSILKKLLKFDHPKLKSVCSPIGNKEELSFVKDMESVLKECSDGIGLAAPQIGITKNVVILKTGPQNKIKVLVNPEIVEVGEEKIEFTEGCLSYPGIKAKTERYKTVKVKFMDVSFSEESEEWFEDLESIVVQHEIDHLFGICKVGDVWREKQARKTFFDKKDIKEEAADS